MPPIPDVDECLRGLEENILMDCSKLPTAGLEVICRLINRNDIDFAACTFDANPMICTNLVLKDTKVAYTLTGFKKSLNAKWKLVPKDTMNDLFAHEINAIIFQQTAIVMNAVRKLATGTRLVAVVEYKFKGVTNTEAFRIYGFNNGLVLSDASHEANTNNGTAPLVLASYKEEEEPAPPYIYLVNDDYDDTLTQFNAL